MELVDAALAPLSSAVGFPVDQLKFVLCVLLSYPLGYAHRFVVGNVNRHIYSVVIGTIMLYICFGLLGLVHFFVSSSVFFLVMQSLPSRYLPRFGFFWMFAYLSSLHIYRLVTDYMGWSMDITAAIMVSLIKITSLGCNYADGKVMQKDPEAKLFPEWKQYAVMQKPNLLQYYSFLLYFPTLLSGPAFSYKRYNNFINGTLFYDEKHNPTGKIPDATVAAVLPFLTSLGIMALMVYLSANYPYEILFVPNGLQSEGYSFLGMWVYLYLSLLAVRCTYYFIWKLAEGAGNLAGLGFSGYDANGKAQWNELINVKPLTIEFPPSLRHCTSEWNIKTGEWLKNYVYLRQAAPGQKTPTYALYLTNLTSAFWHGFYPGYYLSFGYAAWNVDIYRNMRAIFRPLVTTGQGKEEKGIYPQKYIYDVLGVILASVVFNYGQASFVGLSLGRALIFFKNFYFSIHILCAIFFVATKVWLSRTRKTKKTE